MPVPDYLLSESAAGYALYEVTQSEEIGAGTREFLETLKDLYTFSRLVNIVSFTPFKNAAHALETQTTSLKVHPPQQVVPSPRTTDE
jgi:hypothetical protein